MGDRTGTTVTTRTHWAQVVGGGRILRTRHESERITTSSRVRGWQYDGIATVGVRNGVEYRMRACKSRIVLREQGQHGYDEGRHNLVLLEAIAIARPGRR